MKRYFRNERFRFREEFFGGYLVGQTNKYRVNGDGLEILSLADGRTVKGIAEKLNLPLTDVRRFLNLAVSKEILSLDEQSSLSLIVKFSNKDVFAGFGLNAPDVVLFEVTSRCNLRCRYCYASGGESNTRELTTLEIYKVINQLLKIGVKDLIIGGGEPLLRDDLFEIVEYAKERHFYVGVSSNGTLFDEIITQKLAKLPIDHIQISLDASTSKLHDYLRNAVIFNKVIDSIKMLVDFGVTVWVETVVTKKNLSEIPKICKLCADLGVVRFKPTRMIPIGRARQEPDLMLSKGELKSLIISTRRLASEYKNRLTVLVDQTFLSLIDPKFKAKKISWLEEKYFGCKAARTICAILSDGTVTPCPFLRRKEFIGGNIRKTSLLKIWGESASFCRLRSKFRRDTECSQCPHGITCNGGCRASLDVQDQITLNDVLFQKDLLCWAR